MSTEPQEQDQPAETDAPVDVRSQFKKALERKQHQGAAGGTVKGAQSAHGSGPQAPAQQRMFRRKSGG
jgi:hypothetical protein